MQTSRDAKLLNLPSPGDTVRCATGNCETMETGTVGAEFAPLRVETSTASGLLSSTPRAYDGIGKEEDICSTSLCRTKD